jgi:xylulokinase
MSSPSEPIQSGAGQQLLLGLDMGTGSSKAVLVTPDGQIVATAVRTRTHSVSVPRPGWAEVEPEAVWWADVTSLTNDLMARLPAGGVVAGVCISGVGPCLALCDADDKPVRPAILYGIDMRATAEIEELTRRFGAEEIFARGGSALSTQAVGPKALWVQRNEPEAWARAAGWYNSHSYVIKKLTGEYVLDHHSASQCGPLYDIHVAAWYEPWYTEVMGDLAAPRLAWPTEVIGAITSDAAAVTGLPEGTPVCLGTIDAWAEAFSAGVRRPGDLMIMYGSTLFFVQVLDQFAAHPQLWTTAGVDPGSKTLAAGMATSGSLTSWVSDLTGGRSFGDLVTAARDIPAGSDGLLLLPYFAGERTPIFDPRARGVIAGLRLQHTPAHLFRAVYEGTAYGVRQILQLLDSEVASVKRLVAVGGGTQGGLWMQIVSDVSGRVQQVPRHTIGASYGDALMAAIGVGLVPADTDWTELGNDVVPNPDHRAVYDDMYRDYVDLYPATKAVVHHLALLQESTAK